MISTRLILFLFFFTTTNALADGFDFECLSYFSSDGTAYSQKGIRVSIPNTMLGDPSVCGKSQEECLAKGYGGYIECANNECVNSPVTNSKFCLEEGGREVEIRVGIINRQNTRKLNVSMRLDRQQNRRIWTTQDLRVNGPELFLDFSFDNMNASTTCTTHAFGSKNVPPATDEAALNFCKDNH